MTAVLRLAASALFLLTLGLSATVAGAQDAEIVSVPDPLRPADTSSPRDTLRSFLTEVHFAIDRLSKAGRGDLLATSAGLRALSALDFSTTPHSDSWSVRYERLGLLSEILDRIELPPDDEIPGDREVAKGALTQWTIPDTMITIQRIEGGPREGEFLFSSGTVERLDRFYRHARHLPRRPESSAGFFEVFMRDENTNLAVEKRVQRRLKKIDTANPRATLDGFLDSMNRAYALIMEADAKLRAEPPRMTREEARDVERSAGLLLRRAQSTLDLSQTPEAHREDVGIEAALQLKEIFDRMLLPPIDAIPNAQMVESAWEDITRSPARAAEPFRWRLPNTQLEIVEIAEGDRQGQFLFSASTVSRVGADYWAVRDLSYRDANVGVHAFDYLSPGVSKGFYDYYVSTPGYLIPGAHLLSRLIDGLPDGFQTIYAEQTLWQWIGLLLCVLMTTVVGLFVFRGLKNLSRRLSSPLDDWMITLAPAVIGVIVMWAMRFIDENLNITGDLLTAIATGAEVIFAALVVWAVSRLCMAIASTIIASPRIGEVSIDASLVRVGARVVGFLVGLWIVVWSVRRLGADVIPLLAGLGVGGLAVALAAQRTFANFIGSLILYINRPVAVGDFCSYGDGQIGTVEEIGLLSTRIRSLERTLVTVPNADFSEMQLENYQARDQRRLKTIVQLRYETTPEQMRYVLVKLRELLLGHPKVTPDPARVRFIGYGTCSKDIEICCYLDCQEQNDFLAIQEDVLLRMEDIINKAGTGFAFPSQTTYLARDTGLDADRGSEAEAHVAEWRSGGRLPFPEFDRNEREQLEGVLDYPPKGSPDHKRTESDSEPEPKKQAERPVASGSRGGGLPPPPVSR